MQKNVLLKQTCLFLLFVVVNFILYPSVAKAQGSGATIFRDDFTGDMLGNLWQQPTSWTVANRAAYLFTDGGDRWLNTSNSYSASSYIIETAAYGFTVNYYRSFKITFGQQDPSDYKMYVLNFQPYFGGILSLGVSSDNIYYPHVLDQAVLYPNVSPEKVYKFKIAKYESGLIQVYVDRGTGYGSVPFLEAIDSTHAELGHVGWREDTETYPEPFFVDWISVAEPTVEKPAEREKPAEDDLITQVSAKSGRTYNVTKLAEGINAYTDRSYTITSFPAYLNGASFVQTAMDDKKSKSNEFLTSFLTKSAIVYIGYDPRAGVIPDWLKGWTKTGDRIELTDPGTPYVDVYSKLVESWQTFPRPLILGGNLEGPASGAQMNYFLAVVPQPENMRLEAEDAMLSGAKKASNHKGYSGAGFVDYIHPSDDYIEWDVRIEVPGTYNLGFAFANGSPINRSLRIEQNGKELTTLLFQPVSTSWSSWAFISGPNVFLTRGDHKIRATAIGSSGPNMDYLSLSYMSSSMPAKIVTNKLSQTGEALSYSAAQREESRLASAYPNPFTVSTLVSYQVNETARVNVSLFSVQGTLVQVLENTIKTPGKYTLAIDGSKLTSGTYIYRIQQGTRVTVGKLIKM